MEAKTIRVAAAVICKDGRYLLGKRPAHKPQGGLWEFPGGKIESGETAKVALARELFLLGTWVNFRIIVAAEPAVSVLMQGLET